MEPPTANRNIEEVVRERLKLGCPYAHGFRDIKSTYSNGVLILEGRVSSYYLKQILQTRLIGIDGIEQLDNRVQVVSSTEPASTPESE